MVPRDQLGAVRLIHDVERAERRQEAETIPQVVESHLHQREESLIAGMEALRLEIQRAAERITAGQEAVLGELRELRRVLEERRPDRDDVDRP